MADIDYSKIETRAIGAQLDAWARLVNIVRLDETDEQLKQRILAARDSNEDPRPSKKKKPKLYNPKDVGVLVGGKVVSPPPPSPNCKSTAAVNPHMGNIPPTSFCDIKLGTRFYKDGKTWVKTSYNQMAEWDGRPTGDQELRRFDGPLTELVKVVE